jgi:hypothetical protein
MTTPSPNPIEGTRLIASSMELKVADSEIRLQTQPAQNDCYGCVEWFPYYRYNRDATTKFVELASP